MMKLTKYAPATPFDLVADGFFDRILTDSNGSGPFARLPKTNIHETDDAYVLTLEMPGVSKENIDINLEGNTLVVKGEKSEKTEAKGVIREEFSATRFERSFSVGNGIDREKVRAKMDAGILTVTLPKAAEKLGRKIEIA